MSLDYSFGYPDPSLGRGRASLRHFSDFAYFSRVGRPACDRSVCAVYGAAGYIIGGTIPIGLVI